MWMLYTVTHNSYHNFILLMFFFRIFCSMFQKADWYLLTLKCSWVTFDINHSLTDIVKKLTLHMELCLDHDFTASDVASNRLIYVVILYGKWYSAVAVTRSNNLYIKFYALDSINYHCKLMVEAVQSFVFFYMSG